MEGHHTNTWIGIQQMLCCCSTVSGARQDPFPQFLNPFSWKRCDIYFCVADLSAALYVCL